MPMSPALRPVLPILACASIMLSLSLGLRQSIGLFMQPAVKDLSIAVADFTLAIAVQNLAWGFFQPVAGGLADRFGFRAIMVGGAALYAAGLFLLAIADGLFAVMLGAGLAIGAAMACCGSAVAMSVASQVVPAAVRSSVLGIVSAAGSLGALVSAPIGQLLAEAHGWRIGVAGFVVIALIMLPAGWIAGRVDRMPLPPKTNAADDLNMLAAVRLALRRWPFVIMSGAYFICGLQLVFLTTHLPSYLALCGMDPMLSAQALGVIGGFNILGSLFFGWAGGRWSKGMLLGGIYFTRSLVLAAYFVTAPTPETTLVFAAAMGFLWLGVGPLVAGMVAEMFGLRWQAMIQGVAFTSHQLGSCLGAYGGGLLFDAFGSYEMAWKLGVGMGLVAGTIQIIAGLPRWPSQPKAAPA